MRRGEGRAVVLPLTGGHERAVLAPARPLHCTFFLLSAMDPLPVDARALLRTVTFVLRDIGVRGSPPYLCCAELGDGKYVLIHASGSKSSHAVLNPIPSLAIRGLF